MTDFYAYNAEQSGGAIRMEPWHIKQDEIQMILDALEKTGNKKTEAYRRFSSYADFTRAKEAYTGRPPRLQID